MSIKETKRSITLVGPKAAEEGAWFLYRHIRLDTNIPFYIGIGKDKTRPGSKKYRNIIWKGIVGKTDYSVEILFENLSKENAVKKEIEFIALYGRRDIETGCLSNMTSGGEGVNEMVYTKERNAKISRTLTGRKLSQEHKKNNILGNTKRMPVTIKGIEYPSLRQAALALGMHKATVKKLYLN